MARSIITVDFETFYDKNFSLSKLSTQQYVDAPRFEVIGVAVKVDDGPTKWFSGTKDETEEFLKRYDFENSYLLAHNALFDATIITWKFGIVPFKILDTLSMARAVHGTEVGGSLAKLALHYDLGEKGTEVVNALGKRRQDFQPDELEAYASYCVNDVELTYKLFKKLAPKFGKDEIDLIDMTVRMHSEPTLLLDYDVLDGHLQKVRYDKENLLSKCGYEKSDLMSNPKFADLLRELGATAPTKISIATGKETYAFAKTDDAMKQLLEHPNPDVQALVAARVGVKSTLEETRTERFLAMAEDGGALPVPLKYYGAMTGRWAATDGTNLQNIPRGSTLKKAIVAPKGYKIVGLDLSNIELRVGLYFANQLDKLKLLAQGIDLYKDFASAVFNVAYDDVDDNQRFIGKTSQLSLIYGTGHKKLRNAIKMMSGRDIGEALANDIVQKYRQDYPLVKASWYEGERVLQSIRNHEYFDFGRNPDLVLGVHGTAGIKLPSGLFLQYPNLRQVVAENGKNEWVYSARAEKVRIHGPKCFQNTIQALARCVMGEAMLRINKAYPIALTIHDSCYTVVPDTEAREAFDFMMAELVKPPSWAPGLPLAAEGGIGQNLKEAG